MRRLLRNLGFSLARHDILKFIEDHEDDLLAIFREEILRAVMQTIKRFLKEY